jgi:hypothetical protein
MQKLTKEDVQFIDQYLIKNDIKFWDVRIELIDHLATEFEQESEYLLLEDYLNSKRNFIRDFEKKRQKSIHWSYQRQLLKRTTYFFYRPKYFLVSILLFLSVSFLILNFGEKLGLGAFAFLIILSQLGAIFGYFKSNKILKKVQSAQPLLSVMSLPSLFLYGFTPIKEYVLENQTVFIGYVYVAILFNISGFIEVLSVKKTLIKRYQYIIK